MIPIASAAAMHSAEVGCGKTIHAERCGIGPCPSSGASAIHGQARESRAETYEIAEKFHHAAKL
jgi:hypothetical protein